jgi:DNA-binding transcriptional MerR regulator
VRIGELAERTGVSVRSLRYYETKGLLASERTSGGQREYPEAAVDRVRRIQEMFAAGTATRSANCCRASTTSTAPPMPERRRSWWKG